MKKVNFEFYIEQGNSGITIWVIKGKDRRWILDASMLKKDKQIRLALDRGSISIIGNRVVYDFKK